VKREDEMAKGFGIAALILVIVAMFTPIVGIFVSGIAVFFSVIAALAGDRAFATAGSTPSFLVHLPG
jgi:hypothetical protein